MFSNIRNISRTFFWRLANAYFAITLVTTFCFVFFFLRYWNQYIERSQQILHWEVAEEFSRRLRPHLEPTLQTEKIRRELYELSLLAPQFDTYLLSESGAILAASPNLDNPRAQDREGGSIELGPILTFLSQQAIPPNAIRGPVPGVRASPAPFSAARVQIAGSNGYLYVVLAGNRQRIADKMAGDLSAGSGAAIFVLAALLFSLGLGFIVFRRLTRRFREMTRVLAEYRSGNFTTRLPQSGNDEIGEQAAVINSMADTIVENLETIKRKDALRVSLIANVSHDLRTPVAVFRTTIDTLLYEIDSIDRARLAQKLELLRGSGTSLNTLIEELFELARLGSEDYHIDGKVFPLDDLLLGVVEQASALAEASGIDLELVVTDPEVLVRADPALLERALLNLLVNAVKFTPAGGQIVVTANSGNEQVELSIRDSGPGIPEIAQPHLFDRFYQVDAEAKALGGAGIGLAIVKRIVELHDSSITVQSEMGRGTTFAFNLPVVVPDR